MVSKSWWPTIPLSSAGSSSWLAVRASALTVMLSSGMVRWCVTSAVEQSLFSVAVSRSAWFCVRSAEGGGSAFHLWFCQGVEDVGCVAEEVGAGNLDDNVADSGLDDVEVDSDFFAGCGLADGE